jgi:hypothetical protein
MGMYTTLQLKAVIKPEYVAELAAIEATELAHPYGEVSYKDREAEHEFFRTERHDSLLFHGMTNGYKGGDIVSVPGFHVVDNVLTVACEIKNYDRVIEKFFDWIAPKLVLTTLEGDYEYEEQYFPCPLIVVDGKIDYDSSKAYDRQDNWAGWGS